MRTLVPWLSEVLSHMGDRWLSPVEQRAANFARRKLLVIVSLGFAAVFLRLALIPFVPIPVPSAHDEFSFLLAGDTYTHGRLTNPAHPMSRYFDTFHVLQSPTYASKYFPAVGLTLALGQWLGHPWIGVLLTLAAMVMIMTWMLQGWFSPPWALLGGVLVLLRMGLINPWLESYYNSSIATVGAALMLGAYPRLRKNRRALAIAAMAAGAIVLALSRPLEGLFFCIPIVVALFIKTVVVPEPRFKPASLHIFGTFALVLFACVGFFAYYNWRITQSPWTLPYLLYHHRYYGDYPFFAWGHAKPPLHYDNPVFEQFFNVWIPTNFPLTWHAWTTRTLHRLWSTWDVFLKSFVIVPALAMACSLGDRKMRLPLAQLVVCIFGLVVVVWFTPNYAAPLAATLYILVIQGMRHLRGWKVQGHPIGVFLTRLVVLFAIDWVFIQAASNVLHPVPLWSKDRAQVVRSLEATPGQHLVLVHYAPEHFPLREWVYNAADIDHAKIVWARDIPGQDLHPLLNYFKDRKVWLLEADHAPPELQPYKEN
jgi:hypothetical protein